MAQVDPATPSKKTRKYRVKSLDVWGGWPEECSSCGDNLDPDAHDPECPHCGDSDQGPNYEINNWFDAGTVEIPDDATDEEIVEILIAEGFLNDKARNGGVTVDAPYAEGMDIIETASGEPLYQLEPADDGEDEPDMPTGDETDRTVDEMFGGAAEPHTIHVPIHEEPSPAAHTPVPTAPNRPMDPWRRREIEEQAARDAEAEIAAGGVVPMKPNDPRKTYTPEELDYYKRIKVRERMKRGGAAKQAQTIADPELFVTAVGNALARVAQHDWQNLAWGKDELNGQKTESTILTAAQVMKWLKAAGLKDQNNLVAAALSGQGMELIGTLLVGLGLADEAHVDADRSRPQLALYRAPKAQA